MKVLYKPHAYSQQRQREKKAEIYPVLLAMEATYRRNNGDEVYWEAPNHWEGWEDWEKISYETADKIITEPEGIEFNLLPYPDRRLTKAIEYQNNGNFKYHPGTYTQFASGCLWGKCNFCIEKGRPYIVRSIENCIEELQEIKSQGYKEVFDDSATFPTGQFLEDFCKKAPKDLVYGCNMRMIDVDYKMMKAANFRMVLFGLESANPMTLSIINKGVLTEDVKYIIKASKAGLSPHVAVIFGFPWETDKEAIKTLKLVHWLLKKGYAQTAQASFYDVPNKTPDYSQRKYVKKIYDVKYSPEFWFNQLRDIKDVDDIKYLWLKINRGLGWSN